jgi:GNAT superfamily N-acetyltransferase
VVIRTVQSPAELVQTYLAIGRQFSTPFEADDRRLEEPLSRFQTDQQLMLCVEEETTLKGGVIAFGGDVVTVRAVGVDSDIRGLGVGRRLIEIVEAIAMSRGARSIALGAANDARGFYERLGYRGKHVQRVKELPLPGRVRDLRAQRLLTGLDLTAGIAVAR